MSGAPSFSRASRLGSLPLMPLTLKVAIRTECFLSSTTSGHECLRVAFHGQALHPLRRGGRGAASSDEAATRITLRPHDPATSEEIKKAEIVKGFEYQCGQCVNSHQRN
jgi:hypothetical protein